MRYGGGPGIGDPGGDPGVGGVVGEVDPAGAEAGAARREISLAASS